MLIKPRLSIVIEHDTKGPYGSLTQAQARVIEQQFQDQVLAVFDAQRRSSWSDLSASNFAALRVGALDKNDESLNTAQVAAAINELLQGLSVGGQPLNVRGDYWTCRRRCRIFNDCHIDGVAFPLFKGSTRWSLQASVNGTAVSACVYAQLDFQVPSVALDCSSNPI